MLDRRDHRRELYGVRETQRKALGSHRAELNESRRRSRLDVHRTVLEGERREMREARRMHRKMLAQNKWLVMLAERLQERLKKAG
jgi:hypothetical protein